MAEILHLENRHDAIFLPWAVWFGWNFTDWCRMTCRLRRWSKLKREVEFQARLFFQTGNNSISSVDEVQLLHAYSEALGLPDFLQQNTGDFCISMTFVKDNMMICMCLFVQVYSNYGRIFSHFGDIQRQRMAWPWNVGLGLFKIIENGAFR